ncbi:DUF305 domain-containing protein [Streptomyces ipomoeae]|uniref:DUF305 domain-containing protein n=2 Tax=Streptomyces ipomoeae TaxID=103232 RepID=L1L6Q1_9ACTN|nr:DUF305 domain-containing protein [Streptomyces ipomoeae]EKX68469.1 secreted protein with unknown function, PF03713 family [Streptomyces ipomoeae 91-03]MDX2692126.1 DUF305 domain-containing protein [Streptomyces ipomoeae]MDX2820453.1 DUF305 domain-containing protein [Streptomyces ipomoeae]MDX2837501.1 DUF305 domain-containing protein [Streptomyces ipomoeae]MDX2874059.1 DUF305 domain-containing protein [Streptomyces ipomoeae]
MTSTRSLVRRTALTATAVTAALVLAACGSDNGDNSGSTVKESPTASAEATTAAHNDQDVSFAQGMIPHHQQAIQMSKMAVTQASSAEVKDLASRIEKAQDPEIKTMSGWLKAWGEDVPSSMPGMDHGGHSGSSDMPGMMDTEDMDKLMKASGKDFDTMFLTMMVEHHEGAVEMATTEKEKGRYGPAKKMADDIITAQNAEIEEMNKLLGKN